MRVLHVVDRLDVSGGVQTYLRRVVPALLDRGHESIVLSGTPTPGEVEGAPCVHVPQTQDDGAGLRPAARDALRAAIAATAPDVCYLHIAPSPGVAIEISAHVPVVAYAHDYFMVCPGNSLYLARSETFCSEGAGARCFWRAYTERTTNRRPDRLVRAYRRVSAWRRAWSAPHRILVASPFVADVLVGAGFAREAVKVVPYFVEPPPPATGEGDGADVVFVGRLTPSKGIHVLLRALALVEGATAVVAGEGMARPRLERLAADLGIAGRVEFVGNVSAPARADLLAGGKVFAMPSVWDEPFGIAGLEALAAGLPVVASAVGGISSWLEEGRCGFLFPRGDHEALARSLNRLLSDEDLHRRLAEHGPRVAARFSKEAHLDSLTEELALATGRA